MLSFVAARSYIIVHNVQTLLPYSLHCYLSSSMSPSVILFLSDVFPNFITLFQHSSFVSLIIF